jgi:hypothetical protein
MDKKNSVDVILSRLNRKTVRIMLNHNAGGATAFTLNVQRVALLPEPPSG